MSNNSQSKITPVPNLAPTAGDKVLDERKQMEEAAPSAPITYTPDGIKITAGKQDKVDMAPVSFNDLAHAGISFDPARPKLEQDNRHVIDKVYMNSEAFNLLRRELYEHHRPKFEAYLGGLMAHDPAQFVLEMNSWLGLSVQFDSWNEEGICQQYLDALRLRRTVIVLNAPIREQ